MNTLFIGKRLIEKDVLDSTNSFALREFRGDRFPEGAAVIAGQQTRGRGQRGNTWRSEPGKNLLCSIFLKPRFLKPDQSFLLNKLVCVAAARAVMSFGIEGVAVKWPNDLFIGDEKAGGVLIETSIKTKMINSAVAGIGLNVNQTDFPEETRVTSLASASGRSFHLPDLFERYCEQLEHGYMNLKKDVTSADVAYEQLLWGKDDFHVYRTDAGKKSLKVHHLTDEGFLVAQDPEGNKHVFKKYELKLV